MRPLTTAPVDVTAIHTIISARFKPFDAEHLSLSLRRESSYSLGHPWRIRRTGRVQPLKTSQSRSSIRLSTNVLFWGRPGSCRWFYTVKLTSVFAMQVHVRLSQPMRHAAWCAGCWPSFPDMLRPLHYIQPSAKVAIGQAGCN